MLNITTIPAISRRQSGLRVFVLLLLLMSAPGIQAYETAAGNDVIPREVTSAPVIVDGRMVMEVRGVSSYPANLRAKAIHDRIVDVARDKSFSVDDLKVVDEGDRSSIMAGNVILISVFDADAAIESLDRKLLAEVVKNKLASVITSHRVDRSGKVLAQHGVYALVLTVVMALLFWAIRRVFRRLDAWAVRHVHKSVKDLASKSHQLLQADQIWTLFAGLLGTIRVISLALVVYFYLNTALGLFPWTRPFAIMLFDLVLNPVESLWLGFIEALPDLVFLVVLFLVLRYILKLIRMFFTQVSRGRIKLQNFDPDWAMPTHKIVRFLVVAFALVIAYPYIPGSDSMAFKGVSVFIGVIFSLGSSSFIANVLAGLAMTYRGAFKEGDRVKIDDVFGEVEDIKLMTTRIRTIKNEIVMLPNSNILNTNVTNYSIMARDTGLVLHSTVGIGYDTPWRQVEAMLILAAERTEGLLKEPAPYVLQTSMGDFAVNYEINAFSRKDGSIAAIKTDLHRNIQDVFNEYGVQIMSPAYVSDPEKPKVVPPEDWYVTPASKPAEK